MNEHPLDHLALHVADRERAEETVRELLGQQRVQTMRVAGDEGTAHLSVMQGPDDPFRLVLCQGEGEDHPIAQWVEARGPGAHHLAHQADALEPALDHVLTAGGARIGHIVESDGLRQVFTEIATDGVLHEITERPKRDDAPACTPARDTRFAAKNTALLIQLGRVSRT